MDAVEYLESSTVKLDWTVRGLKHLFDSSKGDSKSKVTKSIKFGGGRWQILFYPNSGSEGGACISLYLSCEPTVEEKESSVNGRWIREGLYKFSFELRNLAKTVLYNQKEATDHQFSWKTANWGWAQFARRELVYYQPNAVRHQDAFLITCVITSSPSLPNVLPSIPQRLVPKSLLDTVGTLLDDPTYSDVEFLLPRRENTNRPPRKIYAARTLLRRADYFRTMFQAGFVESTSTSIQLAIGSRAENQAENQSVASSIEGYFALNLEDSDEDDEEGLLDIDESREDIEDVEVHEPGSDVEISHTPIRSSTAESGFTESDATLISTQGNSPKVSEEIDIDMDSKNHRAKIDDKEHMEVDNISRNTRSSLLGPPKIKITVKDVAYSTYRAVLYYLYTDTIVFAPLSSSFLFSGWLPSVSSTLSVQSQSEGQNVAGGGSRPPLTGEIVGSSTRKEWIRDWERNNPGRIRPCSAKAVYRLADKLDLDELKSRAFQHIIKSMTVHNVPFEMFSTFSATFEEVRKMQVTYFLENWNEIRASESMKTIWQQIRVGRHPGFEEVWPLIAMNLEFKPKITENVGGENRDSTLDN